MKRAEEFIIYPKVDSLVTIQSDHRICQFDPATSNGMLSAYKSGGAYFVHLNPFLGAVPVVVPQEVVDECVAHQAKGPVLLSQI